MNCLLSSIYPEKDFKVYSFFYFTEDDNGNVELLPNCHAAYYPLSFNANSGHILKGKLNFFNRKFYDNYKTATQIGPDDYKVLNESPVRKKKALVINLLDDCFGHSVIKLLNLNQIKLKYSEEYDLLCIVPRPLSYLVPEEFFIKIEVKIGFYELVKCYDIQPLLDQFNEQYELVDHFLLSTYNKFNKEATRSFFKFFPSSYDSVGKVQNKITFYYRTGFFRSWGGSNQAKYIASLFESLREYFTEDTEFVVIGDRDNFSFPAWILDDRADGFSSDIDHRYNIVFHESLLVIGCFGSGLYLPSILCDNTVHIVAEDKLNMMNLDSLNYTTSAVIAPYENVNIMGSDLSLNISPMELGSRLIRFYKGYLEIKYKMNIINLENGLKALGQTEYINSNNSHFKYELAVQHTTDVIEEVNKNMYFKNKVERIKSFLFPFKKK